MQKAENMAYGEYVYLEDFQALAERFVLAWELITTSEEEPAQSAPSGENALEDLDAMKRRLMDESDAMDEVATHRWWWRYSQNVDSRLRAALASEREIAKRVSPSISASI